MSEWKRPLRLRRQRTSRLLVPSPPSRSRTRLIELAISTADSVSIRPSAARSGLWFNAGLGYGSWGCQDCLSRDNGLSGNLTIGGSINDRFLIGFGTAGFTKNVGGELFNIGHYDARIRFYPSRTNGFFVTGGAGIGMVSFSGDSETGLGMLLGLGYDIRVAKNVSLTPFWNGYAMTNSTRRCERRAVRHWCHDPLSRILTTTTSAHLPTRGWALRVSAPSVDSCGFMLGPNEIRRHFAAAARAAGTRASGVIAAAESFAASDGSAGAVHESRPETLDYFLTERYCLYTTTVVALFDDGKFGINRGRWQTHRSPWARSDGRGRHCAASYSSASAFRQEARRDRVADNRHERVS